MDKLYAIVDLQFGSTGKGLLAGFMAEYYEPDTLITAWAPNAGHTYVDAEGRKYVNTALPNGIVASSVKQVLIGPGSVINPEQMMDELQRYDWMMEGINLLIHESAAVVTQEHRDMEASYAFGIGSTMKGVGEAVISKIRRQPGARTIARDALIGTPLEGYVVSAQQYNDAFDSGHVGIVEGAQGFSLSINQGFYPYCTSRECTIHQLLSDCAIPRYASEGSTLEVWGTARTYPIRVANRFKDGVQVGTSGPCYSDQSELDWAEIGIEPELTTVTKLPRRIFTWSHQQIEEAIRMNGVDRVFLNFVNYIDRCNNPGKMTLSDYQNSIERAGARLECVGVGPAIMDVLDVGQYMVRGAA